MQDSGDPRKEVYGIYYKTDGSGSVSCASPKLFLAALMGYLAGSEMRPEGLEFHIGFRVPCRF
jgi:hypothetical protein